MMTLTKYIEANASPFFTPEFLAAAYAPFNESVFLTMLYDWCNFNHGTLQIRPLIEDALTTDADIIRKRVTNLVKGRKYQYDRLYNTTLLEYKPIENYDMVEESTDTRSIDDTTTITIGDQTNTSSTSNTTKNGATNSTDKTTTTDSGSVTNEKKIAPFDSSSYSEMEQNTESFNKRSNVVDASHKSEAVTNSVSGESTDKIGGRDDVNTRVGTDTNTHKLTRHGNIGVTTSQQMLESEREVAMFNFIGIVAHDIIKSICICIY